MRIKAYKPWNRIRSGASAGAVSLLLVGCSTAQRAVDDRPKSQAPVVHAMTESPATQPAPFARPMVTSTATATQPSMSADAADPAWQFPPTITGLTPPLRTEPLQPPLPTEIRLLWDKDALYVRFTCVGPAPYSPFGDQRDAKQYQGDAVEIFLDPVGDGRQYFEIQISAANGVLDQNTLVTTDPKTDADGALTHDILMANYWPNVGYDIKNLKTATGVTGHGDATTWITDVAIPADAIMHRLNKKQLEPRSLRMNFLRYHWLGPVEDAKRQLIPINWSPTRFGCPHQSAAAMGTVELK